MESQSDSSRDQMSTSESSQNQFHPERESTPIPATAAPTHSAQADEGTRPAQADETKPAAGPQMEPPTPTPTPTPTVIPNSVRPQPAPNQNEPTPQGQQLPLAAPQGQSGTPGHYRSPQTPSTGQISPTGQTPVPGHPRANAPTPAAPMPAPVPPLGQPQTPPQPQGRPSIPTPTSTHNFGPHPQPPQSPRPPQPYPQGTAGCRPQISTPPTPTQTMPSPPAPWGPVPTSGQTTPTVPATRRGPGWGALIAAVLVAVLLSTSLTVAAQRLLQGHTHTAPASTSTSENDPQADNVAPLVKQTQTTADWQAVSAAVRPATVSIQVRVGNSGDTGSGVVWDNEGHIVTNYHVVADATDEASLTVSLNDGRLYNASVVGTDPTTDLAVIKLVNPPADLVAANFGESDSLSVGQSVMAIGSPLGLDDTVTTGIISALDRPVAVKTAAPRTSGQALSEDWPFLEQQPETEPVVTNAIQVDASINPGNSGGPLFDDAGRVIGINSSIASMAESQQQAGSIGLGFAIPVDLVKNVATQLIQTGKAEHGQLGVSIKAAAVEIDGSTRVGVEVASLPSGSPAAKAGIKVGDYITQIDGKNVDSPRALVGFVRRYNPGQTVTLTVVRDGEEQPVDVELAVLNSAQ